MPELRWTLLLLGILFLAGLGWWEQRKARRARRAAPPGRTAVIASEPLGEIRPALREPTLSLPEIRPREAAHELPVVEIGEAGFEPVGHEIVPRSERIAVQAPAAAGAAPPPDASVGKPAEVIVDWPPEAERRLIGVRLVAALGDRYSGRPLRQALTAAGLVHGRFGIFHYPAPDGRAAFSAASLTKPGNFDLNSMDAQRYAGLSLFAVLPGPLPPGETIERLLETARDLAERLGGTLQDDRGQPLASARIAELRARACESPQAAAPGPEDDAP